MLHTAYVADGLNEISIVILTYLSLVLLGHPR